MVEEGCQLLDCVKFKISFSFECRQAKHQFSCFTVKPKNSGNFSFRCLETIRVITAAIVSLLLTSDRKSSRCWPETILFSVFLDLKNHISYQELLHLLVLKASNKMAINSPLSLTFYCFQM